MDFKGFASMGAKAKAQSLTPEERSEMARKMAERRWGKKKNAENEDKVLKVIAGSPDKLLKIGEVELEVYVLDNGQRVVSGRGMQRAFGITEDRGAILNEILNKKSITPFVDAKISSAINSPIKFYKPHGEGKTGGSLASAFDSEMLKEICDIFLSARRAGVLNDKELEITEYAERLLSGFASVGIIALIDEVTGYQKQKNEYQKILEAYIEKELRPWIMTFEDNYYKQIYRLLGWDWDAFRGSGKNHPSYVGKLTNRIVYEKLPAGVLEALEIINTKNGNGNRKTQHHRYLTENIGYRHLIKHISAVTTIMEMYPDGAWTEALQKIDARFPTQRLPVQLPLDLQDSK